MTVISHSTQFAMRKIIKMPTVTGEFPIIYTTNQCVPAQSPASLRFINKSV